MTDARESSHDLRPGSTEEDTELGVLQYEVSPGGGTSEQQVPPVPGTACLKGSHAETGLGGNSCWYF